MTPAASRFNAAREALALKAETSEPRRRRFYCSRLYRYAHEPMAPSA